MPKKLSDDEKIVLIGMCRYIMNSDGMVTPAELETMNMIAEEIGFDDYQKTFDQADKLITSLETLQKMIDNLRESKNKQKILKYAIQLSRADANIRYDEMDIIVYAADSWDFDIKSLLKNK
jgi:uncharacterized tellurite resistance protein B-like protein